MLYFLRFAALRNLASLKWKQIDFYRAFKRIKMRGFVILVIFSVTLVKTVASEECELPPQLVGEWRVSVEGWKELTTFTNTTVNDIIVENTPMEFTCFLSNGSIYILESEKKQSGAQSYFNYYMCLDIVPSDTSPFLVYFHVRTGRKSYVSNEPFYPADSNDNKTLEAICDLPPNEFPVNYTYFLRRDYEAVLGNDTCPRSLQAEFSVNFTDDVEYRKCPKGFDLSGCDHSHLVFNYTDCDGEDQGLSGSPNYTCLASVENDEVIYTVVLLHDNAQTNPYEFACLDHQKGALNPVTITKSAGTCGGTTFVTMEAEETKSCRSEPSTEAPTTTPAGSENGTQTSNTSTPSTQGPGTGDGGQGGCSTASWGVLSFLLPALVTAVLAAVKL